MVTVPDELAAAFNGSFVGPDDAGYDEVRAVHNGLVDKRPGLIARCQTVADVRDAVNFGGDSGLEISVRGGGHNVAGHAVCDGGLVIDLSELRRVELDRRARVAFVEPGATWGDVDRTTQPFGLAVPGGIVSSTGVA